MHHSDGEADMGSPRVKGTVQDLDRVARLRGRPAAA